MGVDLSAKRLNPQPTLTFGGPPVIKVGRRPCRCLLLVRRSRGSRAAAGRRVSDRVATLDAGEDGRTMGDEDDVTGWSWRSPWLASVGVPRDGVCRRRPDLPWCADVRCVRSQED